MTMDGPHCMCDSPFNFSDRCDVHGSKLMRDRLLQAEAARDRAIHRADAGWAEVDRLRTQLELLEHPEVSNHPSEGEVL